MDTREKDIENLKDYKYGFTTDIENIKAPKGLNENVIKFISNIKKEPKWMLDFRLKAYERLKLLREPNWQKPKYPKIDYQDLYYYSAPKSMKDKPKSLDELDPNLLETYNKLGIMRLTSKGRYAVMAVVDLARFDGINPVSLRDISLRQGISLDYLEQIFSKLRKKEIVQSVRGTQGGYILNRKAKEIKLTNIFDAVDEKVKTVQCKKESKKGCNGKSTKCLTHNLWDELENHINDFFEKKSLEDLIQDNIERRI